MYEHLDYKYNKNYIGTYSRRIKSLLGSENRFTKQYSALAKYGDLGIIGLFSGEETYPDIYWIGLQKWATIGLDFNFNYTSVYNEYVPNYVSNLFNLTWKIDTITSVGTYGYFGFMPVGVGAPTTEANLPIHFQFSGTGSWWFRINGVTIDSGIYAGAMNLLRPQMVRNSTGFYWRVLPGENLRNATTAYFSLPTPDFVKTHAILCYDFNTSGGSTFGMTLISTDGK